MKKEIKRNKGGWNYRVVAEKEKVGKEYYYSIRDVYYTDDKPTSWGADPQWPLGDSAGELYSDLELMVRAYHQPLLIVSEDGETLIEHPNKSPISAKPSKFLK